ncbi:MAG: BatD family protein, partial [Fibrobacteria bacterium]|nr:BatD family protein [Fibrobacteria bacterium]
EISGNGQPKSITQPLLPDLSYFEVFTPETKASTQVKSGYLYSYKSFSYVLIPSRKGEYEIGPIRFPYFDPKSGTFETAESKPLKITVTQGKAIAATNARFLTKKDIEEFGSDIRHIKKISQLVNTSTPFLYNTVWYWALYPLSPVLFGLLLVYRKRSQKMDADFGLRRKVKARSFARKRLSKARQAMNGDDAKSFYHSVLEAVERFMSDKMNIEFRGMTIDRAVETLKEKGGTEELQSLYTELLEQCDLGQFGGMGKDKAKWDDTYKKAETLINKVNKVL